MIDQTHTVTAIAIVIAYLLGSISSAIIVCRLMGLPDPRKGGSGNPGATNVLRIGGRIPALMTFVGDILKGVIPVLVFKWYGLTEIHLSFVMFAAFIGHLYPVFFEFRGGKGVAIFLGTLFALHWPLALAVFATWVIVAAIIRISSLAALSSSLLSLLYNYWLGYQAYYPALILMVIFIYWRHRGNISRMIHGHEPRIGGKR